MCTRLGNKKFTMVFGLPRKELEKSANIRHRELLKSPKPRYGAKILNEIRFIETRYETTQSRNVSRPRNSVVYMLDRLETMWDRSFNGKSKSISRKTALRKSELEYQAIKYERDND